MKLILLFNAQRIERFSLEEKPISSPVPGLDLASIIDIANHTSLPFFWQRYRDWPLLSYRESPFDYLINVQFAQLVYGHCVLKGRRVLS